MSVRPVLFTAQGERVPRFFDQLGDVHELRYGWREVRRWQPGFLVERWGTRYWRLWSIEGHAEIGGSISAPSIAARFAKAAHHPIRRWPNMASIEVYLRTKHGTAG